MEVDTLFVPAPSPAFCCYVTPSISLSEFAGSALVQKVLLEARTPDDMVRVFGMVGSSDSFELKRLNEAELCDFIGQERKGWVPATPGAMKAEASGVCDDESKMRFDFDQGEEEMVSEAMTVELLIENVEAEMNDIASFSDFMSRETSVTVLLSEFPKVNTVFGCISETLRGLLDLVSNNKSHTESVVLGLMKGLQQHVATIFASMGDLKAEPEMKSFGNSISSAMGGLARSVVEMQEELSLGGEDERPTKRLKLSDRLTDLEARLPKLGMQMMALGNEIKALKQWDPFQRERVMETERTSENDSYLAQCLAEAMSRLSALEKG